jgi:hypothetical protein
MSRPQSPSRLEDESLQLTETSSPLVKKPIHEDTNPYEDSSETWSLVVTGYLAAALVTSLSCRLPNSHTLSWTTIFLSSIKLIILPAVGGALGLSIPWFFLKTKPSFRLSFLSKSAAVGWIFFPCITLLYRQQSPWMFLVLTVATVAAALSLRRLFPSTTESGRKEHPLSQTAGLPSLYGLPIPNFRPIRALLIAISAQAALIFAIAERRFLAGLMLTSGLSLLVWRWSASDSSATTRLAQKRFTILLSAFALLFTVLALIPWVAREAPGSSSAAAHPRKPPQAALQPTESGKPTSDYIGIILWPPLAKKTQVIPPIPHARSLTAGRATKPIVIPFDGPYWYFKSPNKGPGPHAHVAHGRATDVNIHSADFAPLLMEAHQHLDLPIDLACCSEIDVEIINADNRAGKISLAIRLTDGASPAKPFQVLGQRTVVSSEENPIPLNRPSVKETLRFPISRSAAIHRFDEITIVFLPEKERSRGGARVSVQSFTLIPR